MASHQTLPMSCRVLPPSLFLAHPNSLDGRFGRARRTLLQCGLIACLMGMPFAGYPAAHNSAEVSQQRLPHGEPWGAEDASAEDDKPRIPEPMVFDLMRPLGAHANEAEVNILGLFPFGSSGRNFAPEPDALAGSGQFDWLLIPQMPWEITDHVMLQGGVGARVANGGSAAEAAIRLIRSF